MNRIEKLKEFLQQNEADDFIQHALALEYIKAGNDEEAKKLFNEILKREPTYIGSYYHLGKLLEVLKGTDQFDEYGIRSLGKFGTRAGKAAPMLTALLTDDARRLSAADALARIDPASGAKVAAARPSLSAPTSST